MYEGALRRHVKMSALRIRLRTVLAKTAGYVGNVFVVRIEFNVRVSRVDVDSSMVFVNKQRS